MARRGRWQEAATDAALAVEFQPSEHYRYHTLVALLAMIRDRPAYEEICKKFVTQFADSKDPFVAERMVEDSLLLPHTGADLDLMDKLAERAVTVGSSDPELPYFQACKAVTSKRSLRPLGMGERGMVGDGYLRWGMTQARSCGPRALQVPGESPCPKAAALLASAYADSDFVVYAGPCGSQSIFGDLHAHP